MIKYSRCKAWHTYTGRIIQVLNEENLDTNPVETPGRDDATWKSQPRKKQRLHNSAYRSYLEQPSPQRQKAEGWPWEQGDRGQKGGTEDRKPRVSAQGRGAGILQDEVFWRWTTWLITQPCERTAQSLDTLKELSWLTSCCMLYYN